MVIARRGAGSLGCLFTLLLIAAIAYFGIPIGEAFVRYYRYEDAMRQSARFARINSDTVIRSHLRAVADSLGLPEEAKAVQIRRMPGDQIAIASQYVEVFELPGTVREHTFTLSVQGRY